MGHVCCLFFLLVMRERVLPPRPPRGLILTEKSPDPQIAPLAAWPDADTSRATRQSPGDLWFAHFHANGADLGRFGAGHTAPSSGACRRVRGRATAGRLPARLSRSYLAATRPCVRGRGAARQNIEFAWLGEGEGRVQVEGRRWGGVGQGRFLELGVFASGVQGVSAPTCRNKSELDPIDSRGVRADSRSPAAQ